MKKIEHIVKQSGIVIALAGGVLSPINAAWAQNSCGDAPDTPRHHHLPANNDTVHWGYFSKERAAQLVIHSGDLVTLETLTHHANPYTPA